MKDEIDLKGVSDRIPCADCYYCYPIGEGEGLCDYGEKNSIVNLFDVEPDCPIPNQIRKR